MKFLFLIFLITLKLCAQDITGVWTGTLYNDTTKQYLKYEVAISEYDGKLSGYSHTIFLIDSIENIGVKSIKIKKTGGYYLIEDDKLIYNNYTEPPAKGVRTYSNLGLSQNDSSMILSGPWKTNTTKIYKSITGNIFLKKKRKIEETLIIPKLENLGLAKSLSFMTYNNYSKDVAINNVPVATPKAISKQGQNSEKNTIIKNPDPLNSPEKKEKVEEPSQELTIKKDTITNRTSLNLETKNSAEDVAKMNLPTPGGNSIKPEENKEPQGAQKASTNNKTEYKAKQGSDNQIIAEDSRSRKNEDTAFFKNGIAESNNNDKEITKKSVSARGLTISKKNPPEVSSINTGANQNKINEKINQIDSEKIRFNSKTFNAANLIMVPKAAADISSRKIETVNSVEIKNDSLLLTLYDNGEIDGDTVSVLLNGKVIMPMQGLTANGISKTVYLTPEMGDSISLIMYAENLGSIPPNTGLLIVYDGNVRHEIRFSGDLQKNSAIILKRKKLH